MTERLTHPCQKAEVGWQTRLKVRLNRARQNRGCALGANRNRYRITVNNCGRDKVRSMQIVHDINDRTLAAGNPCDTGVFDSIFVRGINQPCAERIAVIERPLNQREATLSRHAQKVRMRGICENSDLALSLEQETQFRQCRLATARQDDAAVGHR